MISSRTKATHWPRSVTFKLVKSFNFSSSQKCHSLDITSLLVIDQFEIWLEEFHKLNGYYPSVEKQTVLDAMMAVSKQNNAKLLKKVVKLFNGVQFKAHLTIVVQQLIEEKAYASACRMAIALEFFNKQFKKEDFVLPLIIQDKLCLAEEYLRKDRAMQKEVVKFLDAHVQQPHDMIFKIS